MCSIPVSCRSFDLNRQLFLNFRDLLFGLAVIRAGPQCEHELCVHTRMEYLFRFYANVASNKQDRLNVNELCEMLLDLENKECNNENLNRVRERVLCQVNFRHEDGITLSEFVTMNKNGEFAVLFNHVSLVPEYFQAVVQKSFSLNNILMSKFRNADLGASQSVVETYNTDQKCDSCKRIKYYLSSHFILLSEIGEVNEINRLDESTTTNNLLSKQFKQDIHESDIHVLANDLINRINKFALFIFHSDDIVSTNNDFHNLVENWFFQSKSETINYLKMIANKAEELFSMEPRVLNVRQKQNWI